MPARRSTLASRLTSLPALLGASAVVAIGAGAVTRSALVGLAALAIALAISLVLTALRARTRLGQQTSELRAVYDAFPDLQLRVSADGRVRECRSRSATGPLPPEPEILGRDLRDALPEPVGRQLADAAFEVGRHREQKYLEFDLRTEHGRAMFAACVIPVDGEQIILARDVSEQRLAESALRDSEERYRVLMQNAPEAIVVLDVDLERFVDVNGNAEAFFKCPREELLALGPIALSPPVQPDGRDSAEAAMGHILRALDGAQEVFEWTHCDRLGNEIPVEIRLVRMPSSTRNLVRGSIIDITERRRAERRQRLLMAELDHRVKNTLAAILSLTEHTVQQSTSLAAFAETFTGRIRSLARTHEALAAQRWEGVELGEMVRLSVTGHAGKHRVHCRGPAVRLPAEAASPLSMTLHELTTNALKYGALSTPEGGVDIEWTRDETGVHLTWREHDGPTIDAPPTPGFGTMLIKGFVGHELDGSVDLRYDRDGLRCTIALPLESRADVSRPIETQGVSTR